MKSNSIPFSKLSDGGTFLFDGEGYKKRGQKAEGLTKEYDYYLDIPPDARVFRTDFVKILNTDRYGRPNDERFFGKVFQFHLDCYGCRYVAVKEGSFVHKLFLDHCHYVDLSYGTWDRYTMMSAPVYDEEWGSVVAHISVMHHQGIDRPGYKEVERYVNSKLPHQNFEVEDCCEMDGTLWPSTLYTLRQLAPSIDVGI